MKPRIWPARRAGWPGCGETCSAPTCPVLDLFRKPTSSHSAADRWPPHNWWPRCDTNTQLGDDKFFALLKDWTTRYRHATAVTDDFTGLAANYSDESLRPLWEAWLYSADVP
jgi:hypothetical protein